MFSLILATAQENGREKEEHEEHCLIQHSLIPLLFIVCSTREKQQSRGMGMWFSYSLDLTANSDSLSSA